MTHKKQRVLSGMRPTSRLHLGNLLGAMENWKKYQSEDAFYMIADWHALTTEYESHTKIREEVIEMGIDFLAAGLDPEKATIFVQSDVKEHAELALLLSMITPLAWLERNPTYKDQIEELKGKELHTHGFLGYPVLQAADILLYQADLVPVGEDQLPHLELTREIARRFNHLYRPVFKEPQAALTPVAKLPGIDGRKMSKSYGNTLNLSDSPSEVDNKVKVMITDPARKRRYDKGTPEVCTVYFYQNIFNKPLVPEIAAGCRAGELACVDCKQKLSDQLVPYLEPIYQRRRELAQKPERVKEILAEGAQRAERVARETLKAAKEAVGI